MPDPRDEIRKELDELVHDGELIKLRDAIENHPETREKVRKQLAKIDAAASKPKGTKKSTGKATANKDDGPGEMAAKLLADEPFGTAYQRWYSQALRLVEQLLPDRYDEFRELNRLDKRPKELDVTTYTISEYIQGTRVTRLGEAVFDPAAVALGKLQSQIDILASARARLDSKLADIEGVLEASLLDDELDTARGLLTAKRLRSAGVVAGVVLERHLKRLIANHQIPFRKKAQIGNLNDALKEAGIFDVPQWRRIQRLGDLRNLCGHDGERDPTDEEVLEIIEGVEKVVSTLF